MSKTFEGITVFKAVHWTFFWWYAQMAVKLYIGLLCDCFFIPTNWVYIHFYFYKAGCSIDEHLWSQHFTYLFAVIWCTNWWSDTVWKRWTSLDLPSGTVFSCDLGQYIAILSSVLNEITLLFPILYQMQTFRVLKTRIPLYPRMVQQCPGKCNSWATMAYWGALEDLNYIFQACKHVEGDVWA